MTLHREISHEISAIGAAHDVRLSGALLPDGSEVVVDALVVPVDRRERGIGSAVMADVCTLADKRGSWSRCRHPRTSARTWPGSRPSTPDSVSPAQQGTSTSSRVSPAVRSARARAKN